MKNFNLIERLWTDSHEKQSATRDHHGTKSRELPGNPRPLRYLCATIALPLRYVAMIFAVLVMSIANIGMAWGEETISFTHGFEDNTVWGGSNTSNRANNATAKRTGSKGAYATCSAGSGRLIKGGSVNYDKSNTYTVMCWMKLSVAGKAGINVAGAGGNDFDLTANTWTLIYKQFTASGTQTGKNIQPTCSIAANCTIYVDDVVFYKGTYDNVKPTSASSASATTSSISWTNGSDANTGIQNTLIWRRTSGSSDDLTLNNQGVYAASATDQSGHWTCVSDTVTVSAYAGTFSAGDRYAIVHRDLAYNYSTPTYVTVAAAPSCTNPTASWSTAPADGTAGGNMNASLTTNYATGVVYSSSDPSVATVSGNGTSTCAITYVAAGSARITATVTGDGSTICAGPATCYTDITVSAAGSPWTIRSNYTDNNWSTNRVTMTGTTTVTGTWNITTAGLYEFKVVDTSSDTWYGNTGNIGCNVSGWTFSTGESANCKFFASETGNYTFTFNTSTKALSVTYPSAQGKYYYKNTNSWGTVAVYRFVGGINNGGTGTIITETETICGDTYYVTYADPGTTLIFNCNSWSCQTGNEPASGNAGKYVQGTDGNNGWRTFPTYTVTYNANGDGAGNATGTTGSVPTDASSPYACGSTVTVLGKNTLAKAGYNFTGWNTAPGGGGTGYAEDETFTISANTVLYAQWEEDASYTVTYNLNGGQYNGSGVAPTQAPVESGTGITMPAKVPTKSNYVFGGWTCSIDSKKYAPGQSYTMTAANTTFTAYWITASSMADGTLYKVEDMIPNTWPLDGSGKMTTTEYGIAGGSANGIFDLLGEGYGNDDSGRATPMGGKKSSQTVEGTAFANSYFFKGYGVGNPSGSTLPTARAIKFNIPSAGTLTIYVRNSSTIKLLKSGGSAAVLGSGSSSSYEAIVKDVTAGTWYLYATGGSTTLYGLQFVEESCSATQPGALSKGTLSGCSRTITASGSAATNNTWYWQSSASGTDKSDAYSSGKAITEAGTYYLRSFCSDGSGCWSDAVQVTITAADMTPAAPSALAASSVTAKGVTLTVTDAANTNDYEFYVSTSDDDPDGETTATHSVTSAKSLAITDLYAGTTFYAWARAKCGSNKSAWTALGDGGTFTTSTVTMTPTLTNVTKSSGATSSIGGSDYTAVFTADDEYSMPDPTVTIGGNAATSGTDYTWSVDGSEGTITIPANKINGNIAITLNSADAAPSSAVISGTYHYFPGENISLTCTPSGNNGPTTYQWYKGGKENGNAIAGATSATYTKNSCAFADAGSYYCKVTCNETSIWAVTNSYENYDVKILRLYVNGSKGGEAYGNVDFTKVDGSTATASISLGSGWTYGFNIADGCGHYYGNSGTMTENNCTGWTTNVNGTDCGLTTTNAATYVFTINYSSLEAITTSVTYPTANQAADKVIYFDNQTVDWSTLHYRIGKSNHTQATAMTKVPGTNNLYKVTTAEYNGFSGWHIANNAGWTGDDNSIYRTDTDGDEYEITYATAHEGGAVTESAVTVTPTDSRGTGGDAGINDNCTFYNYSLTTGMKTQDVTISPYSNGTITVNYTNTSNVASSFTSGTESLAHSVILSSITAVPNTGYTAGAITINGNAYAANYVVTGATTVAASFSPKTCTVLFDNNGGTGTITNVTATYDAAMPSKAGNLPTRIGYTFAGFWDGEGGTGNQYYNADGSSHANWDKNTTSNTTLYAKWTANVYDVTLNTNSGTINAGNVTTYTYGVGASLPTNVTRSGYLFAGWYDNAEFEGDPVASISTSDIGDKDYYAKWTEFDLCEETNSTFADAVWNDGGVVNSVTYELEGSEAADGITFAYYGEGSNWNYLNLDISPLGTIKEIQLTIADAETSDNIGIAYKFGGDYWSYRDDDGETVEDDDRTAADGFINNLSDGKVIVIRPASSDETIFTFSAFSTNTSDAIKVSGICINYELTEYTLAWDKNGSGDALSGSYTTGSVPNGTSITPPNNPEWSGYRFEGWNTANDGSGDAYTGTMPAANTIYYAQWAQLYTITNGSPANGTITVASSAAAGDVVDIEATPSSGYVFDGWNIYKTGTPATTVSPAAATATTTFTMPAYDVTVDASFVEQTYALSYDNGTGATGAASGGTAAGSKTEGTTITVPAQGTLSKTDYTFRGWTDGTTFYTAGQSFSMPADDVELAAVWDGGTSCETLAQVAVKSDYSMNNIVGSSAISGFDGSNRTQVGSTTEYANKLGSSGYVRISPKAGSAFAAGDKISIRIYNGKTSTKDVNVALLQSDGKTKTELDAKSMGANTATTFEHTLVATEISGTGYVQVMRGSENGDGGWFISATIEHCTVSNFTVSFDNKTGFEGSTTLPDTIKGVPTDKKIVAPAAPTASGYTFGGWYTDSGCTSAWNWGSSTVSKDTTLYAKWTEKSTPAGTSLTAASSSVCSGSSTTLTLNASTSGVEYELYEGESKLRTVTGTGSALSLGSTSNLTTAKTYTVKTVENEDYKGMTLDVEATVSIKTATSVSVASTSLAATVGESFTIDGITGSGAGDLSYQWYSYSSSGGAGEAEIVGAESDSYTFTPAAAGSYYFKCAVAGDCGTVKSDMITVTATDLNDITMGTHTNGSFTIKVGSADAVSTSTASSAGTTIAIVATPSSGYVFKNWEILDSSSDDITTTVGASATSASTSFTMPSEAVTINAVFVATHTLTVSVSGGVGGSVSPTSTTVGETLTQSISATPSTGYNFSSWAVSGTGASLSSTTTNPTTFTMGTANATVTATFSAKTYSIELNAGNGTGGSESVTMTYNSASHTSITAPTLTGYSLVGWYTGAGGTGSMVMNASGVLQASVDGYTDGGGNWTKDATTTLYAKYTANYPDGYLYITDVMATPETKAGTTITPTINNAGYDGSMTISSHSGYEHWVTTTSSSGYYELSFSSAISASATAAGVAVDVWWGAGADANCGSYVYLNGTDDANKIGDAKATSETRGVMLETLKNLEAVGTTSVSSLRLRGYNSTGTTWFRVGVKEIPGYLLTYDDGDGSGAPDASYQPNATITLSETVPTRSGYVFRGWQVGGAGTVYAPGADFSMPAADVTLVAKWDAACMQFAAATSGSSDVSAKTEKTISTASGGYARTLSGGAMTFYGRVGKIGNNDTYGLVFDSKDDELLTVTLTDAMFEAGTIIVLDCYSVNSNSKEIGFTLSGNACAEGNYTTTADAYQRFTRTYVVTEDDGIDGTSTFTIEGATTNKIYLKGLQVAGCSSCTSISPTLTYSATTLYAFGGTPRGAVPTLTGNTGNGDVTYSSSNTDVVTVNSESGVITAVGAGSATITATIAATGEYCGASKSVEFTIPALVQQTINLNSAWSTVPNMTFPGDPTETLTKNANIAATGYSIDESNNKSGLSSKIYGIPSSTSKNDSYYMSLSFNTSSHPVRLTSVVVPIQPITNTVSAIVTVSDGTTTVTSNEEADIPEGAKKTCTLTITPTVFAADKTITVKIFVYDQTGDKGFRLGSPILVNGAVLVDQKFITEGYWSDPANWDGGSLPEIYHDVVIEKPVVVDIAHATAKSILIDQNESESHTGKLTIEPNMGLEVAGTIRKTTDGSSYSATDEADLVLESNEDGNASLIFDNSDEENLNQATVQMYSKAAIVGNTWNWQYVGTPFTGSIPQYNYYGSWMYKWNNGWEVVKGYDELTPFAGYCLTQESATTHVMGGTLVPTTSTSVTMAATTDMVLANSWTAPIYIGGFTSSTFTSKPATIYLFNTGMAEDGASAYDPEKEEAGTYVTVPVNAAEYTGNEFIAPMQGFFVTTNGDGGKVGSITMNYNDLVRPAGEHTDIVAGPMKAPERVKAAETERPGVMKIWADGSRYNDRVVILSREDFSEGFDNGWDGKKMSFGNESPSVYVINEQGGYDAVSAIPEFEGTVVGFRAGADNTYTIRFEYDGQEVLYLNDLKEQVATPIDNARTYSFSAQGGDNEARFIISATPISKLPTGVDNIGEWANGGGRKVLIDQHIYIIRGGRMFSAEGALVR